MNILCLLFLACSAVDTSGGGGGSGGGGNICNPDPDTGMCHDYLHCEGEGNAKICVHRKIGSPNDRLFECSEEDDRWVCRSSEVEPGDIPSDQGWKCEKDEFDQVICEKDKKSPQGEICDGKDNDGDNRIDNGNVCLDVPGTKEKPCPPGALQQCDAYCGLYRECLPNGTWGQCFVASNCGSPQECEAHSDCPKGMFCDTGLCVEAKHRCKKGGQKCPQGMKCIEEQEICVRDCFHHQDCPEGMECDTGGKCVPEHNDPYKCIRCKCNPNAERWCWAQGDKWGKQKCNKDRKWGKCIPSDPPEKCEVHKVYYLPCCVEAGGCCASVKGSTKHTQHYAPSEGKCDQVEECHY